MDDKKYMEIAIKQAKKALNKDEIPVGAIIVKENKIIGKGYNKKNKSNKICDHAEIIAIVKASKKLKNWRLDDCTIYVTLEPCPMCASAIVQSRIKRICTGAKNNNKNTKSITNEILKNILWKKEILSDESSKLINSFFEIKR